MRVSISNTFEVTVNVSKHVTLLYLCDIFFYYVRWTCVAPHMPVTLSTVASTVFCEALLLLRDAMACTLRMQLSSHLKKSSRRAYILARGCIPPSVPYYALGVVPPVNTAWASQLPSKTSNRKPMHPSIRTLHWNLLQDISWNRLSKHKERMPGDDLISYENYVLNIIFPSEICRRKLQNCKSRKVLMCHQPCTRILLMSWSNRKIQPQTLSSFFGSNNRRCLPDKRMVGWNIFHLWSLGTYISGSLTGHRWHPMLIRYALLLHSQSPAAYRTIRNTGILKLPGETTLRAFTNAIHPEVGFNEEVLEEVKKAAQKLPENQ